MIKIDSLEMPEYVAKKILDILYTEYFKSKQKNPQIADGIFEAVKVFDRALGYAQEGDDA